MTTKGGVHQGIRVPPVIAVTGEQNSGKTTAVEGLVEELSRRGHRVGTVKHCHHGFDLDRPGKDSWRHRQAGAARTVLTSPDGFALVGEPLPEDDLHRTVAWLFPDVDLVLAEGYHWLPLPRIEIVGCDGGTRPAHPQAPTVAQLPNRFGADQILELCDLLEQRYCSGTLPSEGSPEALPDLGGAAMVRPSVERSQGPPPKP